MKVKLNYEHCSISVLGTEIVCPLCKTLVKSGQQHECQKPKRIRKPGTAAPVAKRGESH